MPEVEYIEKSALPPRRQTRGDAAEERAQARAHIQQAMKNGHVLRLTLGADEREVSVKGHYKAAADELGLTIRFQTLEAREYATRRGTQRSEAKVMAALVTE